MIPLPPLCACLSRPEQGELPWSKWELRDAHGLKVAGDMDQRAAQIIALWVNEGRDYRPGLVAIASIADRYGVVERLALEALGEWKATEKDDEVIAWTPGVEPPDVQKFIDRMGRIYSIKDNQKKFA